MTVIDMLRHAEANSQTHPAIYLQIGLWLLGMASVHQGRVRRIPNLYLIGASLAGSVTLMCLIMVLSKTGA
jgi:choline dehydrogenase-like flavoprotein